MPKALDQASWTDFDVKPVLMGYASRATAIQLRVSDKLKIPFPTFNIHDEPGSYEAHKHQAMKAIEVFTDAIMDHVEIVMEAGSDDTRFDRSGFREGIQEMISDALFDADQNMENMKEDA